MHAVTSADVTPRPGRAAAAPAVPRKNLSVAARRRSVRMSQWLKTASREGSAVINTFCSSMLRQGLWVAGGVAPDAGGCGAALGHRARAPAHACSEFSAARAARSALDRPSSSSGSRDLLTPSSLCIDVNILYAGITFICTNDREKSASSTRARCCCRHRY